MTNLEELSDSSNLSEDENVEEDPVVVAENAGATFRTPAGAAIARKRKLPTNKGGSISREEVKHLLLQVPVVNYKKFIRACKNCINLLINVIRTGNFLNFSSNFFYFGQLLSNFYAF